MEISLCFWLLPDLGSLFLLDKVQLNHYLTSLVARIWCGFYLVGFDVLWFEVHLSF